MRAAANFLNAILQGRTLGEMRGVVAAEIVNTGPSSMSCRAA